MKVGGLLSILFILALSLMAQTVAKSSATVVFDEANRREAARLWELAVGAKGGRERLRSIHCLAETREATGRTLFLKKLRIHIVEVSLFPWKQWTWDDERDLVFGLSEQMYNYETGMKYFLNPENPSEIGHTYTRSENGQIVTVGVLTQFEPPEFKSRGQMLNDLAVELLVLNWTEPTVVGMSAEHGADVIHTRLQQESPIAFVFDRKTHHLREWRTGSGDRKNGEWFKNYKVFDGIMMPTESGFLGQSGSWTHTYEFNPEIDESIWERPPAFRLGADGWRKRK